MNWYYKISQQFIQPRKPKGQIRRRTVVKNEGTNRAHEVIQFQFRTKLGNVVKFWMTPNGGGEYDALFYVNDTLDDRASTKGQQASRDPEILTGVLYLMKTKADELGAIRITFTAWKGQKDTQRLKGVDTTPYKRVALQSLSQFLSAVEQYQVKMTEPSEIVVRILKMKGQTPQARPDLHKEGTVNAGQQLLAAINSNANPSALVRACDQFEDQCYSIDWPKFGINAGAVQQAVKNLRGAAYSNVEGGEWVRERNRRQELYQRLMARYFSQDWDISQDRDKFVLTRKQAAPNHSSSASPMPLESR